MKKVPSLYDGFPVLKPNYSPDYSVISHGDARVFSVNEDELISQTDDNYLRADAWLSCPPTRIHGFINKPCTFKSCSNMATHIEDLSCADGCCIDREVVCDDCCINEF